MAASVLLPTQEDVSVGLLPPVLMLEMVAATIARMLTRSHGKRSVKAGGSRCLVCRCRRDKPAGCARRRAAARGAL